MTRSNHNDKNKSAFSLAMAKTRFLNKKNKQETPDQPHRYNNQEIRTSIRCKLQDKFDQCDRNGMQTSTPKEEDVIRTVNGSKTFNLLNFRARDTRKALRDGFDRIGKSFTYMKTSIDSFAQRFKVSTKRREIFENTCATPSCGGATPQTFTRRLLGRTPTKLYSPFSIESPYGNMTTIIKYK